MLLSTQVAEGDAVPAPHGLREEPVLFSELLDKLPCDVSHIELVQGCGAEASDFLRAFGA